MNIIPSNFKHVFGLKRTVLNQKKKILKGKQITLHAIFFSFFRLLLHQGTQVMNGDLIMFTIKTIVGFNVTRHLLMLFTTKWWTFCLRVFATFLIIYHYTALVWPFLQIKQSKKHYTTSLIVYRNKNAYVRFCFPFDNIYSHT